MWSELGFWKVTLSYEQLDQGREVSGGMLLKLYLLENDIWQRVLKWLLVGNVDWRTLGPLTLSPHDYLKIESAKDA